MLGAGLQSTFHSSTLPPPTDARYSCQHKIIFRPRRFFISTALRSHRNHLSREGNPLCSGNDFHPLQVHVHRIDPHGHDATIWFPENGGYEGQRKWRLERDERLCLKGTGTSVAYTVRFVSPTTLRTFRASQVQRPDLFPVQCHGTRPGHLRRSPRRSAFTEGRSSTKLRGSFDQAVSG